MVNHNIIPTYLCCQLHTPGVFALISTGWHVSGCVGLHSWSGFWCHLNNKPPNNDRRRSRCTVAVQIFIARAEYHRYLCGRRKAATGIGAVGPEDLRLGVAGIRQLP